jgi:hypothetical protein
MTDKTADTATEARGEANELDWAGVAVLTLCGALAGLLESLLVPLYLGSTIFPIAIVFALGFNVALPRLALVLVPRMAAALGPFIGWLVVVVGFGAIGRPEGDVILPGAPGELSFVTYGVLLGGAFAGVATVVWFSPARRPEAKAGGPGRASR